MKKLMVCFAVIAAMLGTTARAQDYAGDWQGTLRVTGSDLRMVMRVSKGDNGGWSVKLLNADRATPPMNASSVTADGTTFKFSADLMGASFEGKLSADGKSIHGAWMQGPQPVPLDLVRATKETAWEIPTPAAPPKTMAADADPAFDVATIKPNASGEASLRQLTMNGRNFVLRNGSLADLIAFAYNVQKKQIVNGPDWQDKDRYDIGGVPDVEGAPNVDQMRVMVRKLLADRYKLKFHHEKREMLAFVLSAGKTGPKLTKSESTNTLPNIGMRPAPNGMKLVLANASTAEFTTFLQMLVLDKPVVDQTGITGRYDIAVTFTPDDSQFNGRPPKGPPLAEGTEAAPDLFSAIQDQLGMKLSAEKTPVDVVAIDQVEKPTPN
ncbi:MAG TPA: TIGR03435 family protein [Acidobacteriaceae bacterium]|jgi:uncharacterized protein (TIGR03435 family)